MNFLLQEQEHQQLQKATERLAREAKASITFIVDKNGVLISSSGDKVADIDITSLASLAAGHVAATSGLAEVVQEREFSNLIHEGERNNIYLTIVNEHVILVTIFDKKASLGLVRLRVKRATEEVKKVFQSIQTQNNNAESQDPFGGLTESELDDVFGGDFDFFDM